MATPILRRRRWSVTTSLPSNRSSRTWGNDFTEASSRASPRVAQHSTESRRNERWSIVGAHRRPLPSPATSRPGACRVAGNQRSQRRARYPPPKVRANEVEILSQDQITAVLSRLQGKELYPMVSLALWTGMRRGELCGLRRRIALSAQHVVARLVASEYRRRISRATPYTRLGADRDRARYRHGLEAAEAQLADGHPRRLRPFLQSNRCCRGSSYRGCDGIGCQTRRVKGSGANFCFCSLADLSRLCGEVPERSNGAVSKTGLICLFSIS